MEAGVVCNLATSTKLWVSSLMALLFAQTAMSLLLPRGDILTLASDMVQGALLLLAAGAYLLLLAPARRQNFQARLFWMLLSVGMFLWLTYQGMWNYFEVIRRRDVPSLFVGDIVLFLHLLPMIAALAVLPHLREDERDERIRLLDFALLVIWWVFIYIYAVIPWQTVHIDETAYGANFNYAYLTEKIVLLGALAMIAVKAQGGWRKLYLQLLGANALYACSSFVANWAIGHKTYYSGSLYDIPLSASIVWMGVVPLLALRLDLSNGKPSRPASGVWITRLSMAALFSLLWAAMSAEQDRGLVPAVKAFRITFSLLTVVIMGVVVFWRQRLLRDELSHLLARSRSAFDDLKALQDRLIQSEKLASLGQLVGGAAHEINNPLTAMLGYSDLLSASTLPAEEERRAAEIGQQVRRTTALVSSLLTFARQAPARLVAVDINTILQTASRMLTPQLAGQGVSIRFDLSASLPPVLADSNQILHVCVHLAERISASFDPVNSDRVKSDRETRSALLIRTQAQGKLACIDFSVDYDPKSGPDAQPFASASVFTAEGGNKPPTLSLSACCRIVEEHGGRLLQSSMPGTTAYRMELRIATNAGSYPGFVVAASAASH